MDSPPLRLLHREVKIFKNEVLKVETYESEVHEVEKYSVVDPKQQGITEFDIVSYCWGVKKDIPLWDCGIGNVTWKVKLPPARVADIKLLMRQPGIEYLWADFACINQQDKDEKNAEVARMYHHYKTARKCHIILNLEEVWYPDSIGDDLRFIDHILSNMEGAALASEAARLTTKMMDRLREWAEERPWTFPLDKSIVRAAAVEMGLLNCYSTCINHVRSLFHNLYFTRLWTFQEMLLGKNIIMWGINGKEISCIGELNTWIDLATTARDKALKLRKWILESRELTSDAVKAVLNRIEFDSDILSALRVLVMGINSARIDIINGGPRWWVENYRGICNVFSAVSLTPRRSWEPVDLFRGLAGVFNGLFTAEELKRDMPPDDFEKASFSFFRQLSAKTGIAWTRLAISTEDREQYDWIPVMAKHDNLMTTDCYAGVVMLGRFKPSGVVKTAANTGLVGKPRQYMTIELAQQEQASFDFTYRGCNCGKTVKTGFMKSEPIPLRDQRQTVRGDETGRILVQLSTVLGSILDPAGNLVAYRHRLLEKLGPDWRVTDPNAKPTLWIDRCVSGTPWEDPAPGHMRPHNRSMSYRLADIQECDSRLQNEATSRVTCTVTVDCGCVMTGPFALMMQALVSMEGSFLGEKAVDLDDDGRIVLQDGLGLVQVGAAGRQGFRLVAFGGEVDAYRSHAAACRKTRDTHPVLPKDAWPTGRALVRDDFRHGVMNAARDYGYVNTAGSGNLLICREKMLGPYRIVGVCIDQTIGHKKANKNVTIR